MSIFGLLFLVLVGYVIWIVLRPRKTAQAPIESSDTVPLFAPPAPIWNPYAIGAWSVFLTPVWGAVIVSMNWRALNERRRAMRALIWIVAFFALLPLAVISDGIFYVFLFLPAWFIFSCRPQATHLLKNYGKSYPRRAWPKPVLIGLVAHGVVISVANAITKTYFPEWF